MVNVMFMSSGRDSNRLPAGC